MANFYTDNDDLRFYLERAIDWAPLVELTERGFHQKDGPQSVDEAIALYKDMAQMIGEFVAEEVAPRSAEIDHVGVRVEGGEAVLPPAMDAIFKRMRDLDLHGLVVPRELGGLNCPMALYFTATELFARADVSVMAHFSFHGGIAGAMLMFSLLEGTTEVDLATGAITKTRFGKEVAEILAGKAWGSMDITEPDAGSDMAALRAVGEQAADGSWTVSGQKIFITSGHGKYHFVIARTEKASGDGPLAGLAGLSFFLVPAFVERDGKQVRVVSLDRVEEKMGHHGSVTAALTFDKAPAQLIGKRGEGFAYMLMLMNNARLGVGFESIGMCEAAYRLARDYAAGRPSMGKPIDRHEMIADYLDEMRTDIQGLRALAMEGTVHQERAEKRAAVAKAMPADSLERKRLESQVKRDKIRARRLTPLLKYLGAEKAVELARRAVQIHGGNGYMREYGAEKLLRDAMVMPIYEGTSQIQALMAMKDTLGGIMKRPQAFVRRLAQTRWRALSAADPLERRVARVQALSLGAQQHLITRTATDKMRSLAGRPLTEWPTALTKNWDPKRDFAFALLHAERLIRLLADEAICEILLEQGRRFPERREVLERTLDRCEPRDRFLHDEITTTGARLLETLAERADAGDQATG